jgi:hypothetical protein
MNLSWSACTLSVLVVLDVVVLVVPPWACR